MKNRLLTEIKQIKSLMGLNESDNDECEEQLENDGYVVYNPDEQENNLDSCRGKKNIKCVKEWMDTNGIDSSRINIDSHQGVCYLVYRSEKKLKLGDIETPDITWAFWENGDLSHINTFSKAQMPDNTKQDENWGQYQYKGTFECSGSELESINMRYLGVYAVDKYNKLVKDIDFDVKDKDDQDLRLKASELLTTNKTLNASEDF